MLAIWEYSWTESDWTTTPSSGWFSLLLSSWFNDSSSSASSSTSSAPIAIVNFSPTDSGGGHKYVPANSDFWDVREKYLKKYIEPAIKAIEEQESIDTNYEEQKEQAAPSETYLLRQAFSVALQRAKNAQDMEELQQISSRIRSLALDIYRIEQQNYDRAIAILLLDVF